MIGLTYKLIDKEGFISSDNRNKELIEKYMENSIVVLDGVDISGYGCIGDNVVICPTEWKYFEKVEDTTKTKESTVNHNISSRDMNIILEVLADRGFKDTHSKDIYEAQFPQGLIRFFSNESKLTIGSTFNINITSAWHLNGILLSLGV